MQHVAIVDYKLCNLDSVARAIEECGGSAVITDDAKDIEAATHIILPGVGAFPLAMQNLRAAGLDEVLAEQVLEKQIPFLGICLGMQLMATLGTEVAETPGLGWIPGRVERLVPTAEDTRVPHIGWNPVQHAGAPDLWRGVNPEKDFYFVHSFHLRPATNDFVSGRTDYGTGFVSAVQRDWMWGVQFHPEKSQKAGFQILRNFLGM